MPQMANDPSFLRLGGLSFTERDAERRKVVPAIKEFKKDYKTELNILLPGRIYQYYRRSEKDISSLIS